MTILPSEYTTKLYEAVETKMPFLKPVMDGAAWVIDRVQIIAKQVFAGVTAAAHTLLSAAMNPLEFLDRASLQFPDRDWMTFVPKWIGGIALQLKDDFVQCYRGHLFVNLSLPVAG